MHRERFDEMVAHIATTGASEQDVKARFKDANLSDIRAAFAQVGEIHAQVRTGRAERLVAPEVLQFGGAL